MSSGLRIGVDLGGTKIAAIALDAAGSECAAHRMPAPREDYQATLEAVRTIVGEIEKQAGARGSVGVGIPGSLSPVSGLIQNANSTWLNGHDLERDLGQILERQVRLANDANCFALSEATDGAGRWAQVVFGVILGTGCGGGIVVNGKLLEGYQRTSGEWGHTPLPWADRDEHPGPACWCGRSGCLETWLSGTGLSRDHAEVTGQQLTGEMIVAHATSGDKAAHDTLERHSSRLARGLAMISNILDPDVIVLGGGLSNLDHLYQDVPPLMHQYQFTDHPMPKIVRPVHGDASGVRGAAWLWD